MTTCDINNGLERRKVISLQDGVRLCQRETCHSVLEKLVRFWMVRIVFPEVHTKEVIKCRLASLYAVQQLSQCWPLKRRSNEQSGSMHGTWNIFLQRLCQGRKPKAPLLIFDKDANAGEGAQQSIQ